MKILITTDWSKPVINGVVTSVTNLEEGLRGACLLYTSLHDIGNGARNVLCGTALQLGIDFLFQQQRVCQPPIPVSYTHLH